MGPILAQGRVQYTGVALTRRAAAGPVPLGHLRGKKNGVDTGCMEAPCATPFPIHVTCPRTLCGREPSRAFPAIPRGREPSLGEASRRRGTSTLPVPPAGCCPVPFAIPLPPLAEMCIFIMINICESLIINNFEIVLGIYVHL